MSRVQNEGAAKSDMHKELHRFIFQAYHLIDELTVYENIEETPCCIKA